MSKRIYNRKSKTKKQLNTEQLNTEQTNTEQLNTEQTNTEQLNTEQTNIESTKGGIIKFCVFVGREKNLKILHRYIELGLNNNIFDEYHMFNFSRNNNDSNFILKEYERLSEKYLERIFIHNHENNLVNI